MEAKEKLFRNKITRISFVLAVLVVFVHAYNAQEYSGSIPSFLKYIEYFISEDIAQAAPVLFFIISGFLFFRTFSLDKLMYKYKSRAKSLLVPYLIWNTVTMFIFFFISKLGFTNTQSFALDFPTIFDGIVMYKFNLPFWFMYQLIIFVILAPLIYALVKNKYVGIVCLLGLVVLYCFNITSVFTVLISSLSYYMLGAFAATHFESFVSRPKRAQRYIGIGLFIASQVMLYLCKRGNLSDISGFSISAMFGYLYFVLCAVSLFFIFDFFESEKAPAGFFTCTFVIFAFHNIILETIQKLIMVLLPASPIVIAVHYFVSVAVTVLIVCVFCALMKRFLPKVYSVISGGRA